MRIFAFNGYRYAPAAGEPDALAAPPFDQIDEGLGEELHSRSPYQFSHLTRPTRAEEGDIYQHAAALHDRWVAEGKIQRDDQPSLYPYKIDVADGTRRLGVCALIGVEPEGSGVIRPHEKTLDKPFEDRLNLLRATQIDLEPVMFLADEPGALEALVEQDTEKADPLVRYSDEGGNVHSLYRIGEPERIAHYRRLLEPCSAAIADGHHRYKVGRTYAEESDAKANTGAACKMAVLFSLRSPDMVIDPIHRGFVDALDLAPLHSLIRQRRTTEIRNGEELAAAVAQENERHGPALAIKHTGEIAEIWLMDPQRMPEEAPPGSESLAVAHLHFVLLPHLGLAPETALDGTTQYRSDPETLWQQVESGALALGIWLPPMTAPAFGKAISRGDLLPAKATRFLPKLASGLVWAGHDAALG